MINSPQTGNESCILWGGSYSRTATWTHTDRQSMGNWMHHDAVLLPNQSMTYKGCHTHPLLSTFSTLANQSGTKQRPNFETPKINFVANVFTSSYRTVGGSLICFHGLLAVKCGDLCLGSIKQHHFLCGATDDHNWHTCQIPNHSSRMSHRPTFAKVVPVRQRKKKNINTLKKSIKISSTGEQN